MAGEADDKPNEGAEPEVETGAPPATESAAAPSPGPISPLAQRRIAELTRQRGELERQRNLDKREFDDQIAQLRSELAAMQKPQTGQPAAPAAPGVAAMTEQQVQAEIDRLAEQKAAQKVWDQTCNAIHAKGMKEVDGFGEALEGWRNLGGIPPHVIEAAIETDMPEKVIAALGQDLEEAERIRGLTPARAAAAVAKFAADMGKGKPTPKAKTAADTSPPIPGAVRGTNGTKAPRLDDDNISMEAWAAQRNKELRAAREARSAR